MIPRAVRMNGLRRKDVAIYSNVGIKKSLVNIMTTRKYHTISSTIIEPRLNYGW